MLYLHNSTLTLDLCTVEGDSIQYHITVLYLKYLIKNYVTTPHQWSASMIIIREVEEFSEYYFRKKIQMQPPSPLPSLTFLPCYYTASILARRYVYLGKAIAQAAFNVELCARLLYYPLRNYPVVHSG